MNPTGSNYSYPQDQAHTSASPEGAPLNVLPEGMAVGSPEYHGGGSMNVAIEAVGELPGSPAYFGQEAPTATAGGMGPAAVGVPAGGAGYDTPAKPQAGRTRKQSPTG